MDKSEEIKVLKQLADGIDPYSGEALPEYSPYQHPQTVRALFYAVAALERMKENDLSVNKGLSNAGKPWERAEDDQLKADFDDGISIEELAQKHQRTVRAIEARLILRIRKVSLWGKTT